MIGNIVKPVQLMYYEDPNMFGENKILYFDNI